MTIQKIKSGRVITVDAEEFVGDKGVIFYNESIGDLRLGDGVTPGGQLLSLGGTSTYVLPVATTSTLGGIKVGENLNIDEDGVLSATGEGTVGPAGPAGPTGPKGDTGTQINKVVDIPDVNSAILVNGSLLVYNQGANRWDTQIGLISQDIDAGEF
jgi:hypothetical protein